jgi:hypothetical protein
LNISIESQLNNKNRIPIEDWIMQISEGVSAEDFRFLTQVYISRGAKTV